MITCRMCGAVNDDTALFCTLCGKKLPPPAVGHDFTTGVMRYVPEIQPENDNTVPVYAAQAHTVPQSEQKTTGSMKPATAVLVFLIGVLVMLVIIGVVFLLRYFF